MAIYVGDKKQQIKIGDQKCYLNFFTTVSIVNGIQLLSKDGYVLKDSNGLYLTVKEDE